MTWYRTSQLTTSTTTLCNAHYKYPTHSLKPTSTHIAKALNLWYSTVKISVNARKLVSYTHVYNALHVRMRLGSRY